MEERGGKEGQKEGGRGKVQPWEQNSFPVKSSKYIVNNPGGSSKRRIILKRGVPGIKHSFPEK